MQLKRVALELGTTINIPPVLNEWDLSTQFIPFQGPSLASKREHGWKEIDMLARGTYTRRNGPHSSQVQIGTGALDQQMVQLWLPRPWGETLAAKVEACGR